MSVLAHVVLGSPQQNEPAATQALHYILNKCPDLVRSFIDLIGDERLQFEPGRTDAEHSVEDIQPDLAIFDKDNRLRLFVENKFWASLTKAQPVLYLRKLSNEYASALVFIVPKQRIPAVWSELNDRCIDAGLEWTDVLNAGPVRRASVDSKILLVTGWTYVLNRFIEVANSEGLDEVRADTLQVMRLLSIINLGAFLPLTVDESNNQEVPYRLIHYVDLIPDIVSELESKGIIDQYHRAGATPHSRGRYINFVTEKDKFQSWFGIHFKSWRDEGISPMWCWFGTHTSITIAHFQKFSDLFRDARSQSDGLYVPIRLKTGVERDQVINDVVEQINFIVKKVLTTISD